MAKKKNFVLHEGCYTINIKKLTIDRYYQDKKGGGFRDKIAGFKTNADLWKFVVDHLK